jgi:gluconolactonase
VIAEDGGIYFTDPDYSNRRAQPEAVYYIDPSGELSQVISGFRRPNGIMLSPNGQTLYLAVEAETKIMAYDVGPDGRPLNERLFALTNVDANGDRIPGITNGPDGMTVDPAGNLYAAVQNAVWAWTPTGERLFELPVPENPTNVTFGGPDGKTLFITAQSSLYGIPLNIVPEPSATILLLTAAACLTYRRRVRT